MPVTYRSPLATAVALVGAGAIALTPISAVPAELPTPAIQSASVQLTAAIDPLDAWVNLFANTAENTMTLGQQIFADPAPILTQVLKNQVARGEAIATILNGVATGTIEWANSLPGIMQSAADMAKTGQYGQAVTWALSMPAAGLLLGVGMPLMGLSSVTGGMTENLNNFVQAFGNPMTLFGTVLGVLQTWSSTTVAIGNTVQNFADAVEAGDPLAVASVLIAAPAVIADGFLNGGPNTPGLLTPDGDGIPGPIAGLLVQVRRTLAQAIGAEAPTTKVAALSAAPDAVVADSPAALPSAAASTVAVNLSAEAPAAAPLAPKAAVMEKVAVEKVAVTAPESTVSEEESTTPAASETKSVEAAGTGKVRSDIKKSAESVGKKVNSTISKLRDGLKKGISKPAKPAKPAKPGKKSTAGTSGE